VLFVNNSQKIFSFSKAGKIIIGILVFLIAVSIIAWLTGCGGGGSNPVTTPPEENNGGSLPTGIPGAPKINGELPEYASSSTYMDVPFSVDSYCDSFYVNNVLKLGPGNTQLNPVIRHDLTEGNNTFIAMCKNDEGLQGETTSYSIVLDSTPPPAPKLAEALLTETDTTPVSISIEKPLDCAVFASVNEGEEVQVIAQDEFNNSNFNTAVIRSYDQDLVSGLNAIQLRNRDRAGNYSTGTLSITITYTGSENPSAPTASFSVSPSSGTTSTTFTYTYSCTANCTNVTCTIDFENDGTDDFTDSGCDDGSTTHSYSTNNTYTAKLTITGTAGTNTYTQSVSVSDGGGSSISKPTYENRVSYSNIQEPVIFLSNGNFAFIAEDSDGDKAWIVYSTGQSKQNEQKLTSGGVSGLPSSITNPAGMEYCNNKVYISEGDQIFVFAESSNTITYSATISGSGLSSPKGMGCNSNYLFVANSGSSNILYFNNNSNAYVGSIGGSGSSEGQLTNITDVAADDTYIYVVNSGRNELVKFNISSGSVSVTTQSGPFDNPNSIDIMTTIVGTIIVVSDTNNYEIEGFDTDLNQQWYFGQKGSNISSSSIVYFQQPKGIALDPSDGKLVIADPVRDDVQIFDFP